MRLWIGVHLPRLPLEVFRPSWSRTTEAGAAVLERDRVILCDTSARDTGLRPGMKRGGVLTLAPDTLLFERSEAREEEAARDVALALMQFTPLVVISDETTILMDVSASLRLFGGALRVCQLVKTVLLRFGFTFSFSTAPTGQGAWLLARIGGGRVISQRSLERALDRLPVTLLPAARKYADWFEGIGCNSIGELRKLPRAGLKRRCGDGLLDALDAALGEAPELFEWLQTPPVFDARLELPDRVEHAEAVLFAGQRLISQLSGWLVARQLVMTRFILYLEHERGREAAPPTAVDVALAEPTWEDRHLVRLLKERLGRITLVAPVIAIRLEAKDVQAAAPPSEELFPQPGGSKEDHNRLLELLVARLGADKVLRPAPVADHRPETANRWVPLADAEKLIPPPGDLPRPAWLLENPVQLLTRQHRPFYGSPLRTVSPPERIEAGWHDGEMVTRDYFVAQGEDFAYYWIFRERVSSRDEDDPRWFLHGLFG
ncbi:DNA polymerase Y family protein [Paraburkholderia sp. UCT31]|uniref:Y-family DNA polymerase n=1 Tax=Paraburkholderia sp. UCT31 TaxID=2615209 RepID=UPI001656377D|nr:DNA polymerase Y family protein [Paraburkholderia sp. UCT31]MBC8740409.1 DNA polymerase Y family protein [Paraburkholderia sp. UCT31]